MSANAHASATVHVHNSPSDRAGAVVAQPGTLEDRLRVNSTRISHLEAHVSRLTSRMRALEQQQALLGGLITVYVGLKLVKLILSPLFK